MGGAEPGHAEHALEARLMRIELVKRPQQSDAVLSAAFALHRAGADADRRRHHVLAARQEPARGALLLFHRAARLATDDVWQLHELAIKAAPLILIAVGLSVCYLANIWNIGAEGQFIIGAHRRLAHPGRCSRASRSLDRAAADADPRHGSAARLYAAIPALLKTRFNTNEILTSLMLVYVAQLFLDWLVRGPWRDPKGFNFPADRALQRLAPVAGDLADVRPRALGLRVRARRCAWSSGS